MKIYIKKIWKRNLIITIIALAFIANTLQVSANGYHPNLGDFVWHDLNRNGIQDENEPGIAGITVNLFLCSGDFVGQNITNSTGNYLFEHLEMGNYYVQFVLTGDWVFTSQNQSGDDTKDSDVNTSTGETTCISLGEFETDLTWDAGLYIPCDPASLGDFIWHDLNENGTQDIGEPGVAGITVNLLDETNDIIDTTISDQNGEYLFNQIPAGTYRIGVVLPIGYQFTIQDQGGDDTNDSDVNPQTGRTINILLDCGVTDLTWDAGIYLPCDPAEIGDYVWLDLNINGVQDDGEPDVAGVTVNLLNETDDIIASLVTDANGFYLFTGLPPGQYSIEFILPANHGFTLIDQGADDFLDSDANRTTGRTDSISLTCGESNLTIDAGLYQIGDYTGCTHGFWKNHEENWVKYNTDDTLGSIFEFPTELSSLAPITLMEALNFGGGETLIEKAQILFLQAIAALLNSVNTEVNYPLTEQQIIAGVNDSLASLNQTIILDYKDLLEDYNELGCSCCEDNTKTSHGSKSSGSSYIPPEPENEIPEEPDEDDQDNPPKKPDHPIQGNTKHSYNEELTTTPLPMTTETTHALPFPPGLEIVALLGLILFIKKRRMLQ